MPTCTAKRPGHVWAGPGTDAPKSGSNAYIPIGSFSDGLEEIAHPSLRELFRPDG